MRLLSPLDRQSRTALYYQDPTTGKQPAKEWLEKLKDESTRARIFVRIQRAEDGNFGDHKSVGGGVMELRIPIGPGYRVYYALRESKIILLLVAGDKASQKIDISLAKKYLKAHQEESNGSRQ